MTGLLIVMRFMALQIVRLHTMLCPHNSKKILIMCELFSETRIRIW